MSMHKIYCEPGQIPLRHLPLQEKMELPWILGENYPRGGHCGDFSGGIVWEPFYPLAYYGIPKQEKQKTFYDSHPVW